MNDWNLIDLVVSFRCGGLSKSSVQHIKTAAGTLKKYCEEAGVQKWADFDERHATQFIASIRKRGVLEKTVYEISIMALGLVESLQQLRPGVVHPEFVIPRGQLPKIPVTYHKGVLSEATIRQIMATANDDIINRTYLGLSASIPYLLLLAIRTAINPSSLVRLKRDCLSWNPDGTADLIWEKPRISRQLRQRHTKGEHSILGLVADLQSKSSTEFLFNPQGKLIKNYGDLLQQWIADHKLPPFDWLVLRPTMATLYYAKTGDITAVQRLLQHRELITTMMYLEERTIAPLHQKVFADAQNAYFRRIMK